ncbi:MAG: HigA family addiction module antitoxin [Sulfuricaulis sp.]
MTTKHKRLEPIHPGEILIVNGKRAITADTALRLGKYFGVSPEVWMGLQVDYDLRIAQHTIGDEVDRRVQRHAA